MGIRHQAEWQQRARQHASERAQALAQDWESLRAEFAVVDDKLALQQRRGVCLTMSSAALCERDIECFA